LTRPPIVFVHGAFCGGWSFERFRAPFEARGYRCEAPDLPGHARRAPRAAVAKCSMSDYAKDIAALAAGMERPPVLVGHSLGGLAAMMATDLTPLSGLALLAPCAPWGIAGASFGEAVTATFIASLGPFPNQAVDPDYFVAEQYSLNRMGMDDRRKVFDRMKPESARALWETLTWWLDPFMTTQVGRVRCPTFVAVGGRDTVNPAATVRQIADKVRAPLQVYETMSHWLIGEPGWEAVAEDVLAWVEKLP
jgi:pimeloyl-ACP methyl ester carboxylesterase